MIQKGTAIFDVGGGSIQLSLFDKDRLVTTENIRMGIIRIRERLQRLEDRPSYMVPLIEELVNSEIGAFQRMYVKDREIRSVILIGDYINYVVRRYRKKPEGDTPFVTKEELMADMEQLIALSPAQIAKRLEIPAENESMILPALVVYRKLLKDTPAELIWAPSLNFATAWHTTMRSSIRSSGAAIILKMISWRQQKILPSVTRQTGPMWPMWRIWR